MADWPKPGARVPGDKTVYVEGFDGPDPYPPLRPITQFNMGQAQQGTRPIYDPSDIKRDPGDTLGLVQAIREGRSGLIDPDFELRPEQDFPEDFGDFWAKPQYVDPFSSVLDELEAMHDKKGADYGRTEDPYANVRGSADFGVPPWVGALVRANDKMRRLQKAASGGTLQNEGVEDSLVDLAVYAIIALILWREEVLD